MVDEGLLIVASAVRLVVKNQAILRILRDGESVDTAWYTDAVRECLQQLALEKEDDAARVGAAIDNFIAPAMQPGFTPHMIETDRLKRQREVLRKLAARLREISVLDIYTVELALACQAATSAEIADAVARRALVYTPEPLGEPERLEAMQALRAELDSALRADDDAPPLAGL